MSFHENENKKLLNATFPQVQHARVYLRARNQRPHCSPPALCERWVSEVLQSGADSLNPGCPQNVALGTETGPKSTTCLHSAGIIGFFSQGSFVPRTMKRLKLAQGKCGHASTLIKITYRHSFGKERGESICSAEGAPTIFLLRKKNVYI